MLPTNHVPSPEEIRRRKIFKRGIQFCVLVIGESGTGKSTFINNLCNCQVFKTEDFVLNSENAHINPGLEIVSRQVQMNESNATPITLDVVMCPGLGDNVNNSACPQEVLAFLEQQFDIVLNEEIRIKRSNKTVDTRPHVALYFIRPTATGLRELDIVVMKTLSSRVNVIPIISKADTLTEQELKINKRLIMRDIEANDIRIFDFGEDVLEDVIINEECISNKNPEAGRKIKDILPFAIVASNSVKTGPDGIEYHVREYPWGDVKVEDRNQSDFIYLKNILLGSHLQEFKDYTHGALYEEYRTSRLTSKKPLSSVSNSLHAQNPEPHGQQPHLFYSSNPTIHSDAIKDLEEKNKLIAVYEKKLSELQNLLKVDANDLELNSSFPQEYVETEV